VGTAVLATAVAGTLGAGAGLWPGADDPATSATPGRDVAAPAPKVTLSPRVQVETYERPPAAAPAAPEVAGVSMAQAQAPAADAPLVPALPESAPALPGPDSALVATGCGETGVVSEPVHEGVETLVGALLAPVEAPVHAANCNVVVPVEKAVAGLAPQAANGTDSKPCTLLMCTRRTLGSSTS
jgi:hypothetical protein